MLLMKALNIHILFGCRQQLFDYKILSLKKIVVYFKISFVPSNLEVLFILYEYFQ